MIKGKLKFCLGAALSALMLLQSVYIPKPAEAVDTGVSQIPNTTRTFSEYNDSYLSLTGYAKGYVSDRSEYYGTSYYKKVGNELEFLQALSSAKGGNVKVIEITSDLDLGYNELSDEAKKYAAKYEDPTTQYTNPTLAESGASKITFPATDGLTIFSQSGNTIRHAEFKINAGTNDVAIRNLNFDDMWQWDDSGLHKEVGWTYFKINGGNNIWIDHCSFSLGADGLVDIENGSKNVTISWCTFGLETTENPGTDSMMYKTIMYMESLYQSGKCDQSGRYYKLRTAGATPQMIMAYEAVHSKVHLCGGGDKDYKDDEIAGLENGNQNFRLTLAYNSYTNVMQRVPLMRQGSAHMINCYVDDSGHGSYAEKYNTQFKDGGMKLYRCINPRNGGTVGADTCVFNGVDDAIIGAEKGCDDSNLSEPWGTLFSNVYNRALIVNSRTTNNAGQTYTGSSWDNNGDNQFCSAFKWHDRSTIGNWAWSSEIVDIDSYSRQNYPGKDGSEVSPFEIQYNYNEELPYSYQCLPLDSVVSTLDKYSGSGKISLSAADWIKTSYGDDDPFIKGDVNSDGQFNITDVSILQKWLLAVPDVSLADWKAGDLNKDNILNVFDLCIAKRELIKSIEAYALSVNPEERVQIDADTTKEIDTITFSLDTSSDFILHVNVGYWAAWCNIESKNGKLSWVDDSNNIENVTIADNTVTIKLKSGVYADNVSDTSNSAQMSYYGKISFHHNTGNSPINIISYNVSYNSAANSSDTLVDMSELYGWASVSAYGTNGVTGGNSGETVTVSSLSEIEAAAGDDTPRTIIVKGTITCGDSGITVGSNKTIVGADKNAAIKGGLYMYNTSNIIISNLTLHGFYPDPGPDDCITAKNVHHLWLNHLTLHDAGDGIMDITLGSDYITVSWCKFYYSDLSNGHRLCSLIGSGTGHDDTDMGKLKATYHHNWFAEGVDQRMPRIMYGQGHVYNNYYTCEDNLYCVGVGSYASVLVEGNYFKDVNNPHQMMYTYALPCYITAKDNIYDNTTGTKDTGLGGGEFGNVEAFTDPPYKYQLDDASDIPSIVQANAGPQ